ncbi:putative N-formylglutamate amidohydrolase [Ciceribacter lividus]|uniref:Putative N-formylglutamate amidohydrolase n=1 Tax=Ciceribacter lividus TaxID=1197950 RepID=A0A6I7HSI1_9HYPH|nr:N-formylglutamate amidohydrolase [Ciceribacter lividus]RCW28310.1 putative N-formylglutamate amidohydrolase [Ciceribacter lividus]
MLLRTDILSAADGDAVSVESAAAAGDVLLVCEHASRTLPQRAGDLGLSEEALSSHIAWDPGALDLARMLSRSLDATLVAQRFSRLIYDCNRPPESPAAMPEKSEIYDIPGNHDLDVAERYARTAALYIPFHDRIDAIIAERKAAGRRTVLVTVHSFTPVYMGRHREVEVGILHDEDSRLADAMLAGAGAGFRVERNEPYGPQDGVTHTLRLHGLPSGLANVMIEVRNDLLKDEAGKQAMASYLTGLLQEGLGRISS